MRMPKAGDVVRLPDGKPYPDSTGLQGVVDGGDWYGPENAMVVINASAFRQGDYVSCSGGPCPLVPKAECVHIGRTTQSFWQWGGFPRAGNGVHYEMGVDLWEWRPSS